MIVTKALEIEKSQIWKNMVGLNRTNKCLWWISIFCPDGTERILCADVSRTN